MLGFLKIRLIAALPVIFSVVTLTFLLIHIVPGDPVDHLLGEYASAEERAHMRGVLGLDRPLIQQFQKYCFDIFVGGWGKSLHREQFVFELIKERFFATVILAFLSLLVAVSISVPLAIIAVLNRGSLLDKALLLVSVLSKSVPVFLLGPLLVLLFSIQWRLLPVAGFDSWSGLWLPVFSLGFLSSGLMFQMLRTSLLENIQEDYVRTARSKGLADAGIFYRHILRNASIPILIVIGNTLGGLLAGAVVTETIFDWPGIGRLFYSAFQARDFPLIQGIVLWVAFSYLLINLLIDFLVAWVDPRIRLEGALPK